MSALAKWVVTAREAILSGNHAPTGPLGLASAMSAHIHDIVVNKAAATAKPEATQAKKRPRLVPAWKAAQSRLPKQVVTHVVAPEAGAGDILRFMRLLHHLNSAPWSSTAFSPNQDIMNRLVASHLKIITGLDQIHPKLYSLIDSQTATTLASSQNLVWITNRQQGKTTTLGKFIAAISLAAKMPGGVLCCVYSTKMDRAAELLKAAKEYIWWMKSERGKHPEWQNPTFLRDNANMYELAVNDGPGHSVMARPKNPDTCRGDAFACGIFDEAAFTSADFWYKFALPLLQIRGRIFTCCTTPAPPKGFFDTFSQGVIAANKRGEKFFQLVNHSLSCQRCIDANDGPRCSHRLYLIPPWKPILALSSISSLMPKAQAATYAAEVFGVMANQFHGYLPAKLVRAALVEQPLMTTPPWPATAKPPTVWVAIDPASHSVSDMGMVAIVGYNGSVVIIGCANVSAARCQVIELQAAVGMFLKALRAHPWVHDMSPFVPIVECNNNEVMAHSLVKEFANYPPMWQPFVKPRFAKHITPGVGIWTTEDSKAASLQVTYQLLLECRLSVAAKTATADGTAWDPRAKVADSTALTIMLADQLESFADDEKGAITGKHDGNNDDLGMALLMAVYWRMAVMHMDSSVS